MNIILDKNIRELDYVRKIALSLLDEFVKSKRKKQVISIEWFIFIKLEKLNKLTILITKANFNEIKWKIKEILSHNNKK